MLIGRKVPSVTFRTRVRDEEVGGPNPFRWQDMTSDDYFKGKKVVLFRFQAPLPPLARPSSCRISKSFIASSRLSALMRSTAFRSMTPL